MLEVTFTRTGQRRYRTTVRRDGTVFELRGFDRPAELPHDLAHFVVERGAGPGRATPCGSARRRRGGPARPWRTPATAGWRWPPAAS